MFNTKKPKKVSVGHSSVTSRPSKTNEKTNNTKKVHFSESVLETPETLSTPAFCTLLQLADEMKMIRNSQGSSRSLPEVSKSKNLNFLPEEKIYKDLVDLDVPEEDLDSDVKSQPCIKLKKDQELDFNKYTKYNLQPEYFFSSYYTPVVKKQKTTFDGHSVYQNLTMWSEYTD